MPWFQSRMVWNTYTHVVQCTRSVLIIVGSDLCLLWLLFGSFYVSIYCHVIRILLSLSAFSLHLLIGYYLGTKQKICLRSKQTVVFVRGTFGMIDEGGKKEMFGIGSSNSSSPTLFNAPAPHCLNLPHWWHCSHSLPIVVAAVPNPFVLSLIMC